MKMIRCERCDLPFLRVVVAPEGGELMCTRCDWSWKHQPGVTVPVGLLLRAVEALPGPPVGTVELPGVRRATG